MLRRVASRRVSCTQRERRDARSSWNPTSIINFDASFRVNAFRSPRNQTPVAIFFLHATHHAALFIRLSVSAFLGRSRLIYYVSINERLSIFSHTDFLFSDFLWLHGSPNRGCFFCEQVILRYTVYSNWTIRS